MSGAAIDTTAFRAFEVAGWESPGKAQRYHASWGTITRRTLEPLLDAARVSAGKRILDLASGPGYAAARALARQATVTGVDIAASMVHLARWLHPDIDFREADAESLPFGEGAFDAVIGNFILNHLGVPELAIEEIARVLAPGGYAAFTVWDVPDRARFIGVVLEAVSAAGASVPADLPSGPPIFRFAQDDEFQRLFATAGLIDADIRRLEFVHIFARPRELWDCVVGASVRLGALVLRQPEQTQARIRREFERIAAGYETDRGLELPVSVKLGSARKSYQEIRAAGPA